MDYRVRLAAIKVVKQWYDDSPEPLVFSTAQLDRLVELIEGAINDGATMQHHRDSDTRSASAGSDPQA